MRRRWAVLGLLCVLLWLQQAPLWHWIVEDAAISFAFARNVADGFGLVAYPGGERVEGYSNPLWVALLAGSRWLGLGMFSTARVLGGTLSAATLVLVFRAARAWFPDLPVAAWAAAVVVALDPQHVIWGTSGLENALFSALLAAGLWRVADDAPGAPWAPLCFLGLALTRPEGGAYALLAGGAALARAGRPGAAAVIRSWVTWALVPLLVVHAVRFAYFAREAPATYYAKLGDRFSWTAWSNGGWRYLRRWALQTGGGFFLPLAVVGLVGAHGWRLGVGLGAVVLAGAVAVSPLELPAGVRAGVVLATPLLLTLAVAPRERLPRLLLWGVALVAFGFALRSNGDWMRGFRWLSLATVPLSLLLGLGVAEAASRLPATVGRIPRGVLAAVALAAWAVPHGLHLADLVARPVATPWAIEGRLRHYEEVLRRRLWIDRRLTIVDHDMGGMMWFGRDELVIHDARGLVDLPFALHRTPRPFVRDYLFGERVDHPDLGPGRTIDMVHAHASTWGALRYTPEFRRGFTDAPGYGNPKKPHGGQMIREGLFLLDDVDDWEGPRSRVRWDDVRLEGVRVPSPEVTPGSGLYVEVALTAQQAFRAVLVLVGDGEARAAFDLPPAWDWVPADEWAERLFVGRFSLAVPPELPQGTYALRLVVFGADGSVRTPTLVRRPARLPAVPAYAEGEIELPGVVELVSPDVMLEHATSDRAEALEEAARNRCVSAEAAWERALRHRTRSGGWRDRNRPEVAAAVAACWAGRADRLQRDGDDLLLRVRELEHARAWDPAVPEVWSRARGVAAEAWRRGMAARAAGDVEASFTWFDAAARALPTMAWARRYAEQARVVRLDLSPIEGPHWPFDPPLHVTAPGEE